MALYGSLKLQHGGRAPCSAEPLVADKDAAGRLDRGNATDRTGIAVLGIGTA